MWSASPSTLDRVSIVNERQEKGKTILECPMSSKVLFQFVECKRASVCAVPSMLNVFQAPGYGAQQTSIKGVT